MTRIWLNHWFSAAYNVICLIREKNPDVQIIGSNERAQSPMQTVCDEWYREPVLKDEEYVRFCLDFCREHRIDVFLPRRGMVPISRHKHRFEEIGVRVMVDDYALVSMLHNKAQAYEIFRSQGIGRVPEYYVVETVAEFEEAYHCLARKYEAVCFKFIRDEGGLSFRRIDNRPKDYASLFRSHATRVSFQEAVTALSERERFSPMMVMPFLSGEEISVDCLMTADGLIAIPRVKGAARVERIEYREEILETCRTFFEKIPLEMPCNIQFKCLDGLPYLLEVNTRFSGGVQMSCAASGINLPDIALNKLLGVRRPWENACQDRAVTYVEFPLAL